MRLFLSEIGFETGKREFLVVVEVLGLLSRVSLTLTSDILPSHVPIIEIIIHSTLPPSRLFISCHFIALLLFARKRSPSKSSTTTKNSPFRVSNLISLKNRRMRRQILYVITTNEKINDVIVKEYKFGLPVTNLISQEAQTQEYYNHVRLVRKLQLRSHGMG